MKKYKLVLLSMFLMLVTSCNNVKNSNISHKDIEEKINIIALSGPLQSSNPYDYINANKEIYNELLNSPKETFEFSMNDLINTNASSGLKSYIESLLCSEINIDFKYNFESAIDYLNQYKSYLNNTDKLNDYDKYTKSLLK